MSQPHPVNTEAMPPERQNMAMTELVPGLVIGMLVALVQIGLFFLQRSPG